MIQNGMILDGVYQILGEIGQGGTGIIYLAEHLRLHKRVIVKKIKDHYAGQVNGRAEVDILKRLHHSYLPQVYDFLRIGSSIYTVMEYIEGKDLQYYLDQNYTFPEETIRKWLLQLAQVLAYLHSQNPPILHSDIKPANIMITTSGDVCLIDFNISLDGQTTKDVQGISPWYAAPEQYMRAQHILRGQQDHIVLDGRMDIYSLGAVIYRMTTGYLPSPIQDQSRVVTEMDIPYSDGLRAIVARMIRPAPHRRYASAGKLCVALEDISKADPVYRKYGYSQIGILLGWVMCVIVGVLCIYYGTWKNVVESWQKTYETLYIAAEDQSETEIIATGTEMLNSITYRSYLKKDPEIKADVLYILGESYYRQEQYKEAGEYYREAWDLEPDNHVYCEDYIISLIRDEQYERARSIAGSVEGIRVLSQQKQELIALEIAWMNGETQNAEAELEQIVGDMAALDNQEIIENAYVLLADIYIKQEKYEQAVTVLEQALSLNPDKELQRQLGETAYLAAKNSSQEVYRNLYLTKALENYQDLNMSVKPSYEDRLNLALIQRSLGQYANSNTTLKEMLASYPDEYVIPMWMCYNYLDMSYDNEEADKLISELRFRYQDCRHLYDNTGIQDEDMEQLKEIMGQLGE